MTILLPGADLVAIYNEGTNMKAMNICCACSICCILLLACL